MKRFNFRLEKLLSLREFYEHRAEIDLARAISYLDSINMKLKNIAELLTQTSRQFTSSDGALDINDLYTTQNYIIRLHEEKDRLLNEAVEAQIVIDEKRKIYIEAASKRKVILKLKEKKLEDWKKENNKSEDDFIDDITTFKTAAMRGSK